VLDHWLRGLLRVRLMGPALVLCSLVASGLGFLSGPAMAAGAPEVPITESCSGPIEVGGFKLCGTLNPHSSAKVGSYFAYNAGASCTGGRVATAGDGGEVEGENVKVSGLATELQAGTEYTYCLVATNSGGETFGQPVSFTTSGTRPPEVPITESISNAASSGPTVLETPLTARSPTSRATTKPLTRAQKLSKALALCKKQSKWRRAHCRSMAHRRFGALKATRAKRK
jgi:hypothetical protein